MHPAPVGYVKVILRRYLAKCIGEDIRCTMRIFENKNSETPVLKTWSTNAKPKHMILV